VNVKVTFAVWNLFLTYLQKDSVYCVLYMFTRESESALACKFNYLFEIEGLLKVSHAHCKCGNILEGVPDRVVVTTD